MTVTVVLGLIFLGVAALWLASIPFVTYRLGRHEVEVIIFGLVVRRVMLNNIDDVLVGMRFPAELWPTRWVFSGRFLAIRRKRSLLRYLVITPRDPDRMRANIYYALGWDPNPKDGATAEAATPDRAGA